MDDMKRLTTDDVHRIKLMRAELAGRVVKDAARRVLDAGAKYSWRGVFKESVSASAFLWAVQIYAKPAE